MTMKQITIEQELVMCHCGFYDKSLDPRVMARIHNTREHMGNYIIWDKTNGTQVSQLTGNDI